MGLGINYNCACGYGALIYRHQLARTGPLPFEGATCDTCRELVSVQVDPNDKSGKVDCPSCSSPVRLFRHQKGIACPRCGREDGWEQHYAILAD